MLARRKFALLAVALTITVVATTCILFARLSYCCDFGNVPTVAGYGCFEKITDCTGDTDLLTIDAIDWSRSIDGSLLLNVTPQKTHLYMSSWIMNIHGESHGSADERGITGFAEKKVGGKWVYIGEVEVYDNSIVMQSNGSGGRKGFGCSIYADNRSFQEMFARLPEYDYGATYRLTYFFLEIGENGHPYDEVHSVTHTVTLPKKSNKRLDFVSLGWDGPRNTSIYPEIRVNYGEAPYLLINECTFEHRQGLRWVESMRHGESAFYISPYLGDVLRLSPCENLENHYQVSGGYGYFDLRFSNIDGTDPEHPPTDYRLTLVFCDNADGSGERYTLTLYLNTELLAEYR